MAEASFDFSGKVVLVTGGRSGIGRAVVERLLESGARVACLDVGDPNGAQGDLLEIPCDVRSGDAVREAVATAVAGFGRVDALVQCAGIARDGVLWKCAEEDWESVIDVNLTGAWRVMKEVVPQLRSAGGGAIVNVTSINGLRGKFGQANYSASKAGLVGLTKTAARELGAFGIRVNAVAPGMVRTPMTAGLSEEVVAKASAESALGRISEPEEVASVILFLLSNLARQVTGETIKVDAGQYI